MQGATAMNPREEVQAILDDLNLACVPSAQVDDESWELWLDFFALPRFCRRCGEVMVLRSGRRGKFYGCSAYPKCKYTEDV